MIAYMDLLACLRSHRLLGLHWDFISMMLADMLEEVKVNRLWKSAMFRLVEQRSLLSFDGYALLKLKSREKIPLLLRGHWGAISVKP